MAKLTKQEKRRARSYKQNRKARKRTVMIVGSTRKSWLGFSKSEAPGKVVTYNLKDLPEEERNRILNL